MPHINKIPACELSTQDHQAEVPGDKVGGVCTVGGVVEGNEVGGGCCWLHHLPTQQLTARNTKCKQFSCVCESPSNLFGLCHLQHSSFSADAFKEKGKGEGWGRMNMSGSVWTTVELLTNMSKPPLHPLHLYIDKESGWVRE